MWWKVVKKARGDQQVKEVLAWYIANHIVKMQIKTVNCLQRWERRYTLKQKKIGWFLFTLIGVIYILLLIGNTLFAEKAPKSIMDVERNRPPIFLPPAIKLTDTVNK